MKQAKAVRVAKGKMVFKRGETTSQRFYLLDGSVDLCDADFNIAAVKAGDPDSLHALDPHAPHKVSAVTTRDSILLVVDQKHLDLVLTWDQAGNYLVADITAAKKPPFVLICSGSEMAQQDEKFSQLVTDGQKRPKHHGAADRHRD